MNHGNISKVVKDLRLPPANTICREEFYKKLQERNLLTNDEVVKHLKRSPLDSPSHRFRETPEECAALIQYACNFNAFNALEKEATYLASFDTLYHSDKLLKIIRDLEKEEVLTKEIFIILCARRSYMDEEIYYIAFKLKELNIFTNNLFSYILENRGDGLNISHGLTKLFSALEENIARQLTPEILLNFAQLKKYCPTASESLLHISQLQPISLEILRFVIAFYSKQQAKEKPQKKKSQTSYSYFSNQDNEIKPYNIGPILHALITAGFSLTDNADELNAACQEKIAKSLLPLYYLNKLDTNITRTLLNPQLSKDDIKKLVASHRKNYLSPNTLPADDHHNETSNAQNSEATIDRPLSQRNSPALFSSPEIERLEQAHAITEQSLSDIRKSQYSPNITQLICDLSAANMYDPETFAEIEKTRKVPYRYYLDDYTKLCKSRNVLYLIKYLAKKSALNRNTLKLTRLLVDNPYSVASPIALIHKIPGVTPRHLEWFCRHCDIKPLNNIDLDIYWILYKLSEAKLLDLYFVEKIITHRKGASFKEIKAKFDGISTSSLTKEIVDLVFAGYAGNIEAIMSSAETDICDKKKSNETETRPNAPETGHKTVAFHI